MEGEIRNLLVEWAEKYNDSKYFEEDPIVFPRKFADFCSSFCLGKGGYDRARLRETF